MRLKRGIMDGIPIGLGYLSVSFAFGIMAVNNGLTWWEATLISMTNLTSAGQFAGVGIMVSGGGLIEMAVTEFIINLRYALMSVSLSQKVDSKFTSLYRWLLATGNTDEIFAVSMAYEKEVSRSYFLGLMIAPYIGWSLGTLLGALFGESVPASVGKAFGIAIYGMFIAIIAPKAKREKSVLTVVIIAVALSCLFYYIPLFKGLSSGFSIIICAVCAALFGAVVFPVRENQAASDSKEEEAETI